MDSINSGKSEQGTARLKYAIAGMTLVPLFFGALIAPYLFNLLVWMGRTYEALGSLRDVEFESILTRCILISTLIMTWPAVSLAGSPGRKLKGLFTRRDPVGDMLLGLALGVFTMIAIPVLGLLLGAYTLSEGVGVELLGKSALFVAAALTVGFLEELLFRGVLFDLFRRLVGMWKGVVLASVIFSLVHFLNPILPSGVVHGHWYSGLQTLGRAVESFLLFNVHIFPYCVTLFLIGASLCIIFAIKRDLYMVAGIHAGWIVVLKVSKSLLERTDRFAWFFGEDMIMSKTYGVAIVALLFFLGVVVFKSRRGG